MDKIKTFEDACKALNLNPETVIPDFSMFPDKHQKAMTAHAKLIIIAEALNEGWQPDWSNGRWDKYVPRFNMNDSSAASGFSYHVCARWFSSTSVGSRLCYKSSELAKYAGKQFEDLYRDYFVI